MLNHLSMDQLATEISALAQRTRLDIVHMLAGRGPAGMTAGELSEMLAIPPASLSFHFRQLVGAGLLRQRRSSRNIIYTLDRERMALLAQLLGDWCGPPTERQVSLPQVLPDDPVSNCRVATVAWQQWPVPADVVVGSIALHADGSSVAPETEPVLSARLI